MDYGETVFEMRNLSTVCVHEDDARYERDMGLSNALVIPEVRLSSTHADCLASL